jgi:hypothetical protein
MNQTYLRQHYERCLLSLAGHDFPTEYRWLRAHGFKGLTPWHCLDDEMRAAALRQEFLREIQGGSIPVQDFLPFAAAQHMDDVAGFIVRGGSITPQVCVAHLTWRGGPEVSGYPLHTLYATVWDWLRLVADESREWCSAEELADLVQNIME